MIKLLKTGVFIPLAGLAVGCAYDGNYPYTSYDSSYSPAYRGPSYGYANYDYGGYPAGYNNSGYNGYRHHYPHRGYGRYCPDDDD